MGRQAERLLGRHEGKQTKQDKGNQTYRCTANKSLVVSMRSPAGYLFGMPVKPMSSTTAPAI